MFTVLVEILMGSSDWGLMEETSLMLEKQAQTMSDHSELKG